MKIHITWEGGKEGSQRQLLLSKSVQRLWVYIEGPDGAPATTTDPDAKVRVEVDVRSTWHGRWLQSLLRRRASESAPKVVPSLLVQPSFEVESLPKRFLPYWLDVRAKVGSKVLETASLYVVPRLNRFLSFGCLLVATIAFAYGSWLLVSLSATQLPRGITTLVSTAVGVATPLLAIIGPRISATWDRLAHDFTTTALLLGVSLGLASAVHMAQRPIYFENVASSAVDLRRQVLIEPGDSAVLPSDHIEKELWDYLQCMPESNYRDREYVLPQGEGGTGNKPVSNDPPPCELNSKHWFKVANFCLIAPDRDDPTCRELRGANWLAKVQRWLSPGRTIRIGCRSPEQLDPEYFEEWQRSGSCKLDPELKVTRSLPLATAVSPAPAQPSSCVTPRAEVDVKPFRGARTAGMDLAFQTLNLHWDDDLTGSLPTWRFVGNGKASEVRIEAPHGGRCAHLQVPGGQVNATLERGEQKLGTLWCAEGSRNIFAVRLKSHLVTFRVLTSKATDQTTDVVSRYEATASGLGEWVFWCEPQNIDAAITKWRDQSTFTAEATLASDWQPAHHWRWVLPTESKLKNLVIDVQGHGHWGALDCSTSQPPRTLHLLRGEPGAHAAFTRAYHRDSIWERYSETELYPAWVWFCASEQSPPTALDVETETGSGKLALNGAFAPSNGQPCLIDLVSKAVVGRATPERYDEGRRIRYSAASVLASWPKPTCDPNRSYFSLIERQAL